MKVSYDSAKRDLVLETRGLNFEDVPKIFAGFHFTNTDIREYYGEDREITIGMLDEQVVLVVWTQRDDSRRVITMWKAGNATRREYLARLDRSG